MRPILEIQSIGKKYRIQHIAGGYLSLRERMVNSLKFQRNEVEDFWALKDVSFNVQPGESIGIIGRNGAGKSTLLKILSKITPPTAGTIISRGRIASLLEVGTGFHPELTGRENIFFNGSLLGMRRKEIERKFDEIVDFSGVEKFLDTPLKNFSSGMQLRLAFAVAAFLEPEILIIDEVLAVGDAEFQKKCLGKMKSVASEGTTILFVSHNMDAIAKLCTHGIILSDGRLVMESEKVSKAVSRYLDLLNNKQNTTSLALEVKNEYHTITKFALLDEMNQALSTDIHNSNDIYVSIEGEVLQAHPGLNMGYAVYSATGSMLFWSYCNDLEESYSPFGTAGKFSIKTKIPARLLNEGSYYIELISGIHYQRWLMEPGSSITMNFDIIGGFKNVIFTPKFRWYNGL